MIFSGILYIFIDSSSLLFCSANATSAKIGPTPPASSSSSPSPLSTPPHSPPEHSLLPAASSNCNSEDELPGAACATPPTTPPLRKSVSPENNVMTPQVRLGGGGELVN